MKSHSLLQCVLVLVAGVLFAISAPGETANRLAEAREAAQGGDYRKAAAILKEAAEDGDAQAAFELGNLHLTGAGVEKSVPEALAWFERAADAGVPMALYRQGVIFLDGADGVEVDRERAEFLLQAAGEAGVADAWTLLGETLAADAGEAGAAPQREDLLARAREYFRLGAEAGSTVGRRKYALYLEEGTGGTREPAAAIQLLREAALAGDTDAMNELGTRYSEGRSVEQDGIVALGWFVAAAERGFAPAMTNLGLCHEQGFAVPQNFDRAGSWYDKASKQGYGPAHHRLGLLFEHGRGTAANPVMAFVNYSRAAERGVEEAASARDALEPKLSERQKARARKLLGPDAAPSSPPQEQQ